MRADASPRLPSSGRRPSVLATVIVAIALSVGVFVGAGFASSGALPRVRLCVGAGGAARVLLSAHKSCAKGETLVFVQAWLPNAVSGKTGPAGARGEQGQSGAAGANGAQGPAGSAGPSGAQGPTGASGVQGIQGPSGPIGASGPGDTTVNLGPVTNGVLPGQTITIGALVFTSNCAVSDNAQSDVSATSGVFDIDSSALTSLSNLTPTPSIPATEVVGGSSASVLMNISSSSSSASTESMTFYAIGASSGKIIVGHITLYVSAIGCTDNGYATTLN